MKILKLSLITVIVAILLTGCSFRIPGIKKNNDNNDIPKFTNIEKNETTGEITNGV